MIAQIFANLAKYLALMWGQKIVKDKQQAKKPTCLLWPFMLVRGVVGFVARTAGRLALIGGGGCLMMVGVVVSFTLIGMIIGVPMVIFGALLVIRGIF